LHELATELEREAPAQVVAAPPTATPTPTGAPTPAPAPTPVPAPAAPLVVHVRKVDVPPANLEDIPFAEVIEEEPVAAAASPVAPKPLLPRPAPEKEGAAESSREEPKASPLILNVILGLGVILVLTGALWLVAKGWDAIGDWGRFALLVGL